MQTSLYVAAILLAVLRWVPRAQPLYRWIPSRWQWVPPLVVAVAGAVAQQLGAESTSLPPEWVRVGDASLEAVMLAVMAAQAGASPPPVVQVTVAPLPKASALLLFLGILALGCAPADGPDPCSPDAIRALSALCVEAIERADDEDVAAEAAVCRATVREWQSRCSQ